MEQGKKGDENMKWKWLKTLRLEDAERALILCASAMVVALALQGDRDAKSAATAPEGNYPVVNVQQSENTRETMVHLADAEGYLIPVTCQVPSEGGIAKVSLEKMVASPENDLFAARLGLKTTLPEGTTVDLDIANGHARVDLGGAALQCADAEQEALMVQSVVETLCRFDTVTDVEFLFDGQKRSKLTHGSDLSGVFKSGGINMESVDQLPVSGASTVQLYFPSSSGRMLVPVTRTVYSDPDVTTAVLELIRGPRPDSGLENALPTDLGLRSVKVNDGVVTIDFSAAFTAAMEKDESKQALKALLFTVRQFSGVEDIKILVEGKPYNPPAESKTTALNLSSDIISYYPGVIETD
jgi:germination protein M